MKEHLNDFEKEMRLLNYSFRTIKCYRSILKLFLEHFEQEPNNITEEEIKQYLVNSSSQALLKQRIGTLKLFYKLVVKQPLKFKYIHYPRREQHIPEILSQDEIKRMFQACVYPKHKAILYLFYSTGMRESEVINLKITDIDSARKVIYIQQGKGKKDRLVPLSKPTLEALRAYYKRDHPKDYLFNGHFSDRYSATSIRKMVKQYAKKAGIQKRVYPHLLRHCAATHLYESGVDLSVIQHMLGHKQQKTTKRYAHMSTKILSGVKTPDCMI